MKGPLGHVLFWHAIWLRKRVCCHIGTIFFFWQKVSNIKSYVCLHCIELIFRKRKEMRGFRPLIHIWCNRLHLEYELGTGNFNFFWIIYKNHISSIEKNNHVCLYCLRKWCRHTKNKYLTKCVILWNNVNIYVKVYCSVFVYIFGDLVCWLFTSCFWFRFFFELLLLINVSFKGENHWSI